MFRRILATLAVAIASILVSRSAVAALLGTFTFGTLPGSPSAGDLAWLTDGSGTTNVGDAAAGGGSGRDLVSWDAGQARWEFVTRIPATVPPAALEKFLAAVRIDYNNTGSGASATDVQAALDELFATGGQTDLGTSTDSDTLTITSSTGAPAVLPSATPTTAGVLTGADKAKLDDLAEGGGLEHQSSCANSTLAVCIDENGVEWRKPGDGIPYPVGPLHTKAASVATAGLYSTGDVTVGVTDSWSCAVLVKLSAIPSTGSQNYVCYLRIIGNASSMFISLIGSSADTGVVDVRVNMWDSAAAEFKDVQWHVQADDTDWHSLVVTYDGSAVGDPVRLYYDGGEFPFDWRESGGFLDGTGTMDEPAGRSLRLAGNNGTVNGLNGFLHSAAFGPVVLTPQQVGQLYNAGPAPNYTALGFTHVYYPCENTSIYPTPLSSAVASPVTDRGLATTLRNLTATGTATCVDARPPAPVNPIRGRSRLVAYGDSRVQSGIPGAFEPESETFLAFLPRDYLPDNRGQGGRTCAEVATAVETDAPSLDADVAVIQCGVNDALQGGFSVASTRAAVQSIVDDLVAEGIRVVVTTPFPVLDGAAQPTRQANTAALAADWVTNGFAGAEVCDTYGSWMALGNDAARQVYYEVDGIHIIHREGDEVVGPWVGECLGAPTPF